MKPAIDGQSRFARSRAATTSSRRAPSRIVPTSVVKRAILVVMTAMAGTPCKETCTRAFCTAIAETASIPATVAMAALGSMHQQQRPQRVETDRFKPACRQSRQAEHQHEDRNRQDRSPRRSLAGDNMRGDYHKVAGDVSGKQSAETKEADHIHAPRGKAKHTRQQSVQRQKTTPCLRL